jgi:hypothetical protein
MKNGLKKMTDDIVTRLRGQRTNGVICEQAADEIERLREWKELAYEMRNRSWWAMRKKVLVKFDDMHKSDWKRHE